MAAGPIPTVDRDTHLKHLLTAFLAISLFFLITWMIYLGQEVLVPLVCATAKEVMGEFKARLAHFPQPHWLVDVHTHAAFD